MGIELIQQNQLEKSCHISAGFGTCLGNFVCLVAVVKRLEVPVLVVCGLLDFMTPAFTQYEIAGLAPKVKLIPIAAGRDQWINWRLLAYLPLPIYKEGKVRLLFKWALSVKKVYFGGVLLLKERCLAVWQLNCLAPIQ